MSVGRYRPDYYDRQGRPITMHEWAVLRERTGYFRVAETWVGHDVRVSTVWLGLDHNFGDEGPPLIFETMVFGGPLDECQERYGSELAANAGHDRWVAAAKHTARIEQRQGEGGE